MFLVFCMFSSDNSVSLSCTVIAETYRVMLLHLDAILTNAKRVATMRAKSNGNQKPFEKMIIMKYDCVGIGVVKMNVG